MSEDDRITRIEQALDRHINFVGESLVRLEQQVKETSKQVQKTSAAQEVTEKRLQKLIRHVDRVAERVDKLEGRKP